MLRRRFVTRSFPAAHVWAHAVVSVATTLVAAATLQAANVSWTLPEGDYGDWSVSTNWGGGVPISTSNVYINNGGTASITKSFLLLKGCFLTLLDSGGVRFTTRASLSWYFGRDT